MNGNKFLLDTNAVLFLLEGHSDLVELTSQKLLYVSFISELELLGYKDLDDEGIRLVQNFLSDCYILEINQKIKEKVIHVRKIKKMKLPDAIIAATAMYMDIPLISFDKDFNNIPGLSLVTFPPL